MKRILKRIKALLVARPKIKLPIKWYYNFIFKCKPIKEDYEWAEKRLKELGYVKQGE